MNCLEGSLEETPERQGVMCMRIPEHYDAIWSWNWKPHKQECKQIDMPQPEFSSNPNENLKVLHGQSKAGNKVWTKVLWQRNQWKWTHSKKSKHARTYPNKISQSQKLPKCCVRILAYVEWLASLHEWNTHIPFSSQHDVQSQQIWPGTGPLTPWVTSHTPHTCDLRDTIHKKHRRLGNNKQTGERNDSSSQQTSWPLKHFRCKNFVSLGYSWHVRMSPACLVCCAHSYNLYTNNRTHTTACHSPANLFVTKQILPSYLPGRKQTYLHVCHLAFLNNYLEMSSAKRTESSFNVCLKAL